MADRVCPVWVGYLLLNPLRRLLENPKKILGPYLEPGMTVLEPGCGMGYFTLPLARMVGPRGRVVAVDLQPRMIRAVERRAAKAGLAGVVETRLVENGTLGVEDLEGRVDFAAAIHLIHEVPDQGLFFEEISRVLKPGGRLLAIEPKGHVKPKDFQNTLEAAQKAGLGLDTQGSDLEARVALFRNQ